MEYLTMKEAAAECGIPIRTFYRLAKEAEAIEVLYGRHLIPKSKLAAVKAARRPAGNPNWVGNPEGARAAGKKAAKIRWRKTKKKKGGK